MRGASELVVRYRLAGSAVEGETPAFDVTESVLRIPVLGLLAEAQYHMKVVASGPGGIAESHEMLMTTGSLPSDLPRYAASGSDPSPGFVTFAAGRYAVAIDNTGRVVWYRHLPDGAGLNMMAQPMGRYVLRPPTPEVGDLERWVELDVFGEVTRTLGCVDGLPNRIHDLLLEPSGSYWIMCDEQRIMDLRAERYVVDNVTKSRSSPTRTRPFRVSSRSSAEASNAVRADARWCRSVLRVVSRSSTTRAVSSGGSTATRDMCFVRSAFSRCTPPE